MSHLLEVSNLSPRKLLTTTALAALFAVAGASLGHAAGANAQIFNDGFSPSVIKIVSENGSSWTKIEERALGLPVAIDITAPGNSVIQGYITRQAGLSDGIPLEYNNFGGDPQEHFSGHRYYVGKTELMTAAERQAAIGECNEKLGQGGSIHNTYNTFTGVGVKMQVTFLNAPGHQAQANVTVPVECVAVPRRPAQAGAVTSTAPDFKVKEISLRFMTTAGYTQQPDPATRCKLTHVRVRVPTTKAGAVKFKLWTKVGNEPMKSEVIDAWSSFVGPGKFEATYTKPVPVTKTTSVQAKAEEMINPIGLSTPWKDVTVHCTGAGGGGFASTPGNANPDGLPQGQQQSQQGIGPAGKAVIRTAPAAPDAKRSAVDLKTAPVRRAFGADRFQRSKVHVN